MPNLALAVMSVLLAPSNVTEFSTLPVCVALSLHMSPSLRAISIWDVQVPAYVPYSGRPPSASPATGFSDVHKREQDELCTNAMDLEFA